MPADVQNFDIVIFGASGCTGRYAIEELANSTKSSNLKWAISGRSIEKLTSSLQKVQKYLPDIDILNTPIIKADVSDPESILKMCKKAKVILNCVGPYKLYSEAVIIACIEAGTHYVDLSAELGNLELSQAHHFQLARRRGIYIIQACGFASIPADYGISLLKNKFPGDLNSVEYYVEIEQGPSGRATNIGTLVSVASSLPDFLKISAYDRVVKEMVFKKDLIQSKYRLSWRFPPLYYSSVVSSWCVWFLGPDQRVIKRSQWFRSTFLNERPVQHHGYAKLTLLAAFRLVFVGLIIAVLSFFSCGLSLLEKYYKFFTLPLFGQFSKDGPTRQQVEESKTKFILIGEGWKYKLPEPMAEHASAPDTKMKLTITGPEAAYPLTAMCMVQAGLVILEERDKMPLEGGVLTPGVAFEHTTLSSRLEERGMKFVFEKL